MAKHDPLRLADIRRLRGYRSQAALAEAVGVTQETVSLWERGARMPALDTAVRAATLLNLTPQELYGYIQLEREIRRREEASA